jgi:hypothetical protein
VEGLANISTDKPGHVLHSLSLAACHWLANGRASAARSFPYHACAFRAISDAPLPLNVASATMNHNNKVILMSLHWPSSSPEIQDLFVYCST